MTLWHRVQVAYLTWYTARLVARVELCRRVRLGLVLTGARRRRRI
jgi:hypothetical protein